MVGIVTAILNPNENQRTFVGIGFAVPIENAASAVGMPVLNSGAGAALPRHFDSQHWVAGGASLQATKEIGTKMSTDTASGELMERILYEVKRVVVRSGSLS